MPFDKKTVAQLREERGFTREQLAAAIGIPYSTLVNIELFRNKPRAELVERFYLFFDVPVGMIQWSKPPETSMEDDAPKNEATPVLTQVA